MSRMWAADRWLSIAVAALFLMAPPALAQISPGPLTQAHRELEGPLNCTKCHGGRKEAMELLCVGCHRDIGWLIERRLGFHGLRQGERCASCHPEHAGADFAMIKWPDGSAEQFKHTRTGWPLEKSHLERKCADCHTTKFQVSPAASLSARRPAPEWTGLDRSCASCHEDVHRGALGGTCTKCHDAGKWELTPGFSHDSTAYTLTGKHTTVSCAKCHLAPQLGLKHDPAGKPIPVYRPVPHGQCSACHTDPHSGQLGPACADCHTTAGFKVLDKQTFNHDRTRYPLRGRHAAVPCAKCHDFSTPQGKKPAFATCTSCHRDAHAGTATLAGKAVDCAACHDVTGFSPSTFTVQQHRSARYPLDGKHAAVRCGSCHRRDEAPPLTQYGSSRVVMRPASSRCLDCHADDHGGQLTSRGDRGECASCHVVAGWKPTRYDAAAHARLKVTLEGKHGEVPCAACHGLRRTGLKPLTTTVSFGKAAVVFRPPETTCVDCHLDPHQGRFAAGGESPAANGCLACHDQTAFRPSTVSADNHGNFALALDGAHRAVPCVACHADMEKRPVLRSSLVAATVASPALLLKAPRVCADCHQTPHGDQFASRKDGGRCDACHGVETFVPASRFDHNRDASFSLKGAHEGVRCDQCHVSDTKVPGRLIFRPLSGKCETCHGAKRGP